MDAQKRDKIYNRLLSFKMSIDVAGVPNPRYLNEKLGECRVYLDEIERYSIETYQALSAIQQALNTSQADYETKQEDLLTTEDIKSLPSDKVREAKVNNLLKAEIAIIKLYENELQALNYLLKALNLKNKNITSDNADLKAHIKIMESQIRLGSGSMADPAVRSLLEEFKKSNFSKDPFEGASTSVSEEETTDPSTPLDVNNLLRQGAGGANLPSIDLSNESDEEPEEEDVAENLTDPDPTLDPENNGEAPEEELVIVKEPVIVNPPQPVEEVEKLVIEEEPEEVISSEPLDGLDIESALEDLLVDKADSEEVQTDVEAIFDLEQVIDFTQTTGGTSQVKSKDGEVKIVMESEVQKQETKEPDLTPDTAIVKNTAPSSGLDLDSLLDDLNLS